jgi:ATP-dependent RNA helicase RhlE
VRTAVVFGGASIRSQIQSLKKGVHVLVATPGRLMDLMNQGYAHLDGVEIFVLDEADRMLDMGFVRDVKKISAAIPKNRQTALFSATMPKSVEGLANGLLKDPVHVEVAPQATTAERVDQCVLFVKKDKKRDLLNEILDDKDIKRVLIFTRTKHRADRVVRNLIQAGVKADAIHGNKAQNARQRALGDFKSGKIRALVATDIAARGIDVDDITHVINFELPNDPDSYVHRIGRTARAGADGMAISFCGEDERGQLRDIEKTIRQSIAVVDEHPYHAPEIASDPGRGKGKGQGQGQKQRSGQKRPGQGRRKAHRKGQGGHGGGRPGGRSGGQAKAA